MPIDTELQSALDALKGETKTIFTDLATKYGELKTKCGSMQVQLDAVDAAGKQRHVPGGDLGADPMHGLNEFKRLLGERRDLLNAHGRIGFEIPTLLPAKKSTIVSTGITSVAPSEGIQAAGRFNYRLRQMFSTVPVDTPSVGALRSTTETINPSPQIEAAPKAESTFAFTLYPLPVQTLAHFVNFTRQVMDDVNGFMAFINSTLVWGLERKAESQILSGDGTGANLTGLMNASTAFDSSILSGSLGWNRIDILGAAATQLQEAGFMPDFAVVSPRNWFRMISLRTTQGEYVLNDPRTAVGRSVYALTVIPSDRMLGDAFVVGDSNQAVIRQKMEARVDVSFEHASNFTSNLATALAEERFLLQILRPDAYVNGTLASSPA